MSRFGVTKTYQEMAGIPDVPANINIGDCDHISLPLGVAQHLSRVVTEFHRPRKAVGVIKPDAMGTTLVSVVIIQYK